jgi:hypothetical protein
MAALAKLSERFTAADIDEEIVLMRLDTGDFFSLSGTAAVIWRLIDGARDREQIISALATEFDTSDPTMAPDVDEFLDQMKQLGFVDCV